MWEIIIGPFNYQTQMASDMSVGTKFSSVFVVPKRGLHIYGGSGYTQMQWLPSSAASWSFSNPTYKSITTSGVCAIQVSKFIRNSS